MKLVESLSEEDLFTSGRYAWTKTNALAAYIVSCTSSHYRWARTDTEWERPYRNAPPTMGIFATRSPLRPNPIALTAVVVQEIDYPRGMSSSSMPASDQAHQP